MKKFDIAVAGKPYTDKSTGIEKKSYKNVGTLTIGFSEKTQKDYKILELNMFPTTDFLVFEQKPREGKPVVEAPQYAEVPGNGNATGGVVNGLDYGEPIDPKDIPF